MKKPFFLGAALLGSLFLAGCDAYTALKTTEIVARAVTQPTVVSTPVAQPTYYHEASTGHCYLRNEPATADAPRSFSQVPCTAEVRAQLKLQPRDWHPPVTGSPHG